MVRIALQLPVVSEQVSMVRKLPKIGFLAILALYLGVLMLPSHLVSALSGSDFNPGHIIDDTIFTDTKSMSVSNTQNFLNSQVPTCNTNHTGFTGGTGTVYNPPFVCLKDFYENPNSTYTVSFSYTDTTGNPQTGSRTYYNNNAYKVTALCPVYVGVPAGTTPTCGSGNYRSGLDHLIPTLQTSGLSTPSGAQSAAQIIYNAAQQYSINPQVLIVLLQKEQGLVTDTWPASYEYQEATGYGCPDTAPCSSNYAGFSNQVTSAAWQFRQYLNYPNNYNYTVGNNYIQYNPVSSCGGSTVNVQNQATAALYDYTPYQPNAGALSGVSDTSPGGTATCGAYGNRNFWWYFNTWFGGTLASAYTAEFESQSAYPSLFAGQSTQAFILYRNAGTADWYDDTSVPIGIHPVHLATTNPINRSSNFGSGWSATNRPALTFAKVYASDGTSLTSNQHVVHPGEIAEFDFPLTAAPAQSPGTYQEYFQPILEGSSNWDMGGQAWLNVTVQPTYQAQYFSESAYPSMKVNDKSNAWIAYKNTGNAVWYDDSSVPNGSYPVHLATADPVNRLSGLGQSWPNQSRPALNFASVYESDGITLAPDQHQVQPGEIAHLNITFSSPLYLSPGTYQEYFQPILEGSSNWDMGGQAWLNVTVTNTTQSANYFSESAFPTISRGGSGQAFFEFKNTGNTAWYDDNSAIRGIYPLHLATANPTNRPDSFADTTWISSNRPAGTLSAVYEGDGSTLAADQHVVQPGQIGKFQFTLKVPADAQTGSYQLYYQPIFEGGPDSSWDLKTPVWLGVTVQ